MTLLNQQRGADGGARWRESGVGSHGVGGVGYWCWVVVVVSLAGVKPGWQEVLLAGALAERGLCRIWNGAKF